MSYIIFNNIIAVRISNWIITLKLGSLLASLELQAHFYLCRLIDGNNNCQNVEINEAFFDVSPTIAIIIIMATNILNCGPDDVNTS